MDKKEKRLTVRVDDLFYQQVIDKSKETGIPYSEVLRRSLEVWLTTGEMPKLPKPRKGATKQ